MNEIEIKNKILDIVAGKADVEKSELELSNNLTDDLGLDSLDGLEILIEVERECDITISDEEAEKLHTIGEIYELVKSKKL